MGARACLSSAIAMFRPVISRHQALALARAECDARGWPWREPVHVARGLGSYHVMTNARSRGGNVNIRIGVASGQVISATFAQR